jgi:hypothetical protein
MAMSSGKPSSAFRSWPTVQALTSCLTIFIGGPTFRGRPERPACYMQFAP